MSRVLTSLPGGFSYELGAPAIVIALTLVTVAISDAVLFFVVPLVIAQAYRGVSLEILNGIIQGRAGHGLDRHLPAWHLVARRILLGVCKGSSTPVSARCRLDRMRVNASPSAGDGSRS